MDKKKIIIIVAIVAILAVGGFIIYKRKKKQQEQEQNVIPLISDSLFVDTTTNTYVAEKFPLDIYMKGDNVKKLQEKVNVKQDGYLGPITKEALESAGITLPIKEESFKQMMNSKNWKKNKYTGLNGVEDLMC